MKAAFTLIPAESRRLIAKAVVQMEEVKTAMEKAYVILNGGTSNGYIAQELFGMKDLKPETFTAGTNSHRLLCVTEAAGRTPFPIIYHRGKPSSATLKEALNDFHKETVVIKGANAVDPNGRAAVIAAGFDGGTMGATLGTVVSQGLKYIVPVGLEKLVASVDCCTAFTGAKTFDYTMGADFGMFCIPNALVVTEIEALKILAGVEAMHVASGGIGESAGSVVLVARGDRECVQKAVSLIESIKGEPTIPGFKGNCGTCPYRCVYAGKKPEQLPAWLA
jgi:hypothetical protein